MDGGGGDGRSPHISLTKGDRTLAGPWLGVELAVLSFTPMSNQGSSGADSGTSLMEPYHGRVGSLSVSGLEQGDRQVKFLLLQPEDLRAARCFAWVMGTVENSKISSSFTLSSVSRQAIIFCSFETVRRHDLHSDSHITLYIVKVCTSVKGSRLKNFSKATGLNLQGRATHTLTGQLRKSHTEVV